MDFADLLFLVQGLVMGFAIAAVVGPIGLLCISRTLRSGFWHGLVTGMGAATADAIYGCIAASGLTVITTFLLDQQNWIHLLGGTFLFYLGLRVLLTSPAEQAATVREPRSFLGAYTSTLLLTLTNPLTILSFMAIFAGLGMGDAHHPILAASLVVLGVFCGSACWWLLLSGGIHLVRKRFTSAWLLWINRAAGSAILLFGAYTFLTI